MTVPSTIRKAGPYNGNDVATSFAFAFKVFTSADIAVTMADVDGTETLLVLDSDYSVTLNGDQDASPGGSITYPLSGTPLATGEALVIVGDLDYGQDYDVPTGGNFNPTAMEDALDKQAMRTQQLLEINERSMTLAVTSDAGVSTSLPVPEASGFLGWNATADALINYAGVAGVAVSSFMETVVAAATAALARAALGFTAVGDAVAIAANAAAARTAIGGAASGLATASGLTMSTARMLGRTTAGTGALEEKTSAEVTAFLNAATETAQGAVEMATVAEGKSGTDATRFITPVVMKAAQIQLQTAVTLTTQTAVDFTSIPSWVNRISLLFSGVSTNGTSVPIVQLGDAGGFETSGYTGNVSVGSNSVAWTVGATPASGFGLSTSTAAASVYTGKLVLDRGNGNEWVASGDWAQTTATISTHLLTGAKTLSATLTQIRLTTVGGSDQFDAGTVNISYE